MKIKERKGITLIVLVITIVIMAILAGAVIVSVSGYGELKNLKVLVNDLQSLQDKIHIYYEKNGELPVGEIITEDVITWFDGNENENDGDVYYKIDLTLLENISLTYGKEQFEKDYFIVNEESHNVYYYAGFDIDGDKYYGIKDVASVLKDTDFGIETFELKTNVSAVEGAGVANIQLEVYTDLTGYNYKFKINDEEWTPEQTSNKYTFTNLNRSETYKVSMMIIDENGNEIFATNNGTEVAIGELPINATIDGKLAGTYNNPIIPAGFTPLNENDANWKSSDGFKKGLVITDEVDVDGVSIGNEFVWVPVDGTNVLLERVEYNKGSIVITNSSETFPTDIDNSIDTNGGFYISRYEIGNDNSDAVSKKRVNVYTGVNFSDAQAKAGAMYPVTDTEHGVISTLIYGAQWDATLDFITTYNVGETGYLNYATDSTGMGNYSSGDDYTDTTAPIATGISDLFRQKNIYDIAGNVGEWTMEATGTSGYVVRGGTYAEEGSVSPASARHSFDSTTSGANTGFRVALYIES